MKVIRVFPNRLKKQGGSMLPKDNYAFIGDPPMERPEADEVHVSVTFTWDREDGERLKLAWGQYYPIVKIGGPAFGSIIDGFMPGKYIKPGVTFTSRGCNNQCPWCLVPESEGKLFQYYDFVPGHIVQDNNLLQCEKHHIERVFEMLRYQGKAVTFSGGLDSRLMTDDTADSLRSLPINQLFLACDTKEAIKPLRKAVKKLSLPSEKVRCYVHLKFNENETISEATERMIEVWKAGAMPFAQLYQPKDKWIDYSAEWRNFARQWSRPAIMKSQSESD